MMKKNVLMLARSLGNTRNNTSIGILKIGHGIVGSRLRRWISSAAADGNGKRFAALWGNGDFGRLGHGSIESQWTPKPLLPSAFHNQSLRDIACGGAHTLFLTGSLDPSTWFSYDLCEFYVYRSTWLFESKLKSILYVVFWFPFSGRDLYLYADQPHYSLNFFWLVFEDWFSWRVYINFNCIIECFGTQFLLLLLLSGRLFGLSPWKSSSSFKCTLGHAFMLLCSTLNTTVDIFHIAFELNIV